MERVASVTVCDDAVAGPSNVLTGAERSRLNRQRKRPKLQQQSTDEAVPPKTPAERSRAYRARVKQRTKERNGDDASRVERVQTEDDDAQHKRPQTSAERSRAYRQRLKQRTMEHSVNVTLDSRSVPDYVQNSNTLLAHKFQMYMQKHFFNDTLDDYCRVCDRLWWSSRLVGVVPQSTMYDFLKTLNYNVGEDHFRVCNTCYNALRRQKVPTLATVNGYVYPEIPPHLPDLCPVSERLIAPRLPFMQIRQLRYFSGSKRLVGQVINVPVDVNTMVTNLPRKLEDDYVFNLSLKRNLLHKSSYMANCISKTNIKIWLKYLLDTPLYRKYNIAVNDAFFENRSSSEEDEDSARYMKRRRRSKEFVDCNVRNNVVNLTYKTEKHTSPEEMLTVVQQTLFWGEDAILNMAPGQFNRPLALAFDEDAEELSFPTIYYGQLRQFQGHATPYSIATSEIRRSDRRGVKSDHILYMAAKILRLRVIQSFNVMFRSHCHDDVHITRSQLEDREFIKETMDRNESFLKQIPNSVQYWHSRKRDLFAMMRQLGKPTVFMTLSASEIHWYPLLRYVYKFQQNLLDDETVDDAVFDSVTGAAKAELVNSDPVICCLYFDKLVACIINALKKTSGPFGKYYVVDYFRRIEFQHRGSPHCHILLWLANAPNISETRFQQGEDMPEVIQLLDSLCSVDQTHLNSGRPLQHHHHTHTCFKKNTKRCRFGAPFWPMDKTRILLPVTTDLRDESKVERFRTLHINLETQEYRDINNFLQLNYIETHEEYLDILRHGISRPMVFLKRDIDDIWTSPFNPSISSVLQSNMDIQFILDEYSCAAYVAEYVNKSERGFSSLHRELIRLRDMYPDMDYEQCMKELGKRTLNNVEMCAQEAAWFLLRLPMSEASRRIVFIPTQHPTERFSAKKTKQQMDFEGLGAASTDVWKSNIIQVYEQRPPEMNEIHLADCVALYDAVRGSTGSRAQTHNDDDGTTLQEDNDDDIPTFDDNGNDENGLAFVQISHKRFRKRSQPKVLRWKTYNVSQDPLNYMRERVTLFWPFRSEELDLLDSDAYIHIYNENIDTLIARRKIYESGLSIENVMRVIDVELTAADDTDANIDPPAHGPVFRDVEVPYVRRTDTIQRSNDTDVDSIRRHTIVRRVENVITHVDYCAHIRSLNDGQKSFVLEFINRLLYEQNRPLQVFFTGPAGSGKSYVLKVLMETANRFTLRRDSNKCAYVACATTGKAAVNIDGNTVHTAFHISINTKKRMPLRCDVLQTMRCDFDGVCTIFVDEVSMMSSDMLNQVGDRLRSLGPDPTATFGGLHVIFCGDLRQLPPVNARAVYTRPPNMLQDRMLWHGLEYYSLTEVVRQSDKFFSDVLTKIGNGEILRDDERALIERRFFTNEQLADMQIDDAIRLFHRNVDVDQYNYDILNKPDVFVATARDEIRGYVNAQQLRSTHDKIRKLDVTSTGNMPTKLLLELGTPYIVTHNIDKLDKIVNGSFGYLRYVENDDNGDIQRLWLEFSDTGTGAVLRMKYEHHIQALGLERTWTPIVQREGIIDVGSKIIKVRRKQFPLVPAHAMSIHKSQGGTYDKVVYEYSKSHDISLVYVALSRAKSVEGLFLTNRKGDFAFHHCRKHGDREVLRTEFRRIRKHKISTVVKQCATFITSTWAPTIAYLNIQSIGSHAKDVTSDPVLKQPKLLSLSETWMRDNDDPIHMDGFRCIARKNSSRNRAGGVAIYESLTSSFSEREEIAIDTTNANYGDACCVRFEYKDSSDRCRHFYLITIYAKPGVTREQLINLMDAALMKFSRHTMMFHINNSEQLYNSPLLVCGDFNFDMSCPILLQYLQNIHSLSLATRDIVTTRQGTRIDGIFYKSMPIEIMPYISYFSTHRPLLARVTNSAQQQQSSGREGQSDGGDRNVPVPLEPLGRVHRASSAAFQPSTSDSQNTD